MKNKYIKLIFSFCVSLILCYYCYHQLTTSNSYVATNTPISQKIDTSVYTSDTLKTKVLVDSAIVLPQTQKIIKKKGFSVRLGKAKIAGNISNSINKDSLRILGLNENESYELRSDMVNVTGDYFSYRMNPDGTQFSENIFIELPYDLNKIPIGYTVNDVRTYYYDVAYKSWIEINFDSVNFRDQTIVSRVNHFTDFMNAIIKQPEMPETSAFVPTKLADMKPADPLSGFSLIGTPEANSNGSVLINYPIDIPNGRNGLQPELNLSYQNRSGSSWLGQDWNLSIPFISIETRWGVPLYDKKYQSETYLLNGKPLITKTGDEFDPLTYRNDFKKRKTGVVQFYPRVESAFNQIFRHGDSPDTYWWEVIDKSGVHFYYGKSHSAEKADPNFVLDAVRFPAPRKDANGYIGKWMLSEIQDLSGNRVLYYYDKCNYRSGDRYILPQKIVYTCYKQDTIAENHYQIQFKRKSRKQLKMLDNSFNCRLGMKEVANDLLTDILITYKSSCYRHYSFTYKTGAFGKTLLKKVSVINPANPNQSIDVFDLDYYDKPKKMFSDDQDIGFGAISNSHSNSWGLSGSVGGGLGFKVYNNTSTINGSAGYNQNSSSGLSTLIDITGDGYPDRVFIKDDKLVMQELSDANSEIHFLEPKEIDISMAKFQEQEGSGNSFGGQFQAGSVFNASYNYSTSKSITRTYFSDVDGNGMLDLINDGRVFYNKGKINGKVKFVTTNSDTIYIGGSCDEQISVGKEVSDSVYDDNYIAPSYYYTGYGEWGVVRQSHIDSVMIPMPNFEIVRMWIAPYSGQISIKNLVYLEKISSKNSIKNNVTDGVKCWIQHNMTDLNTIGKVSKTDSIFEEVLYNVKKGDKIYFRIQSLESRLFDKVVWNPIITYVTSNFGNDSTMIDAEGLSIFKFNPKEDFLVNDVNNVVVPFDGKVKIESIISLLKPLSSPVRIRFKHNGFVKKEYDIIIPKKTTLESQKYDLPHFTVSKGDLIELEIVSEGNVKWNEIELKSELYYESLESDPTFISVDSLSNPNENKHTISFDLFPKIYHYSNTVVPSAQHEFSQTAYYHLELLPSYKSKVNRFGDLKFVIKSAEQGLEKVYNVSEISNFMISQELCSCKHYYFDLYSDDREYLKSFDNLEVLINGEKYRCGVHTVYEDSLMIYGPLYRNWGQFIYINHGDSLMDESLLMPQKSVVQELDTNIVLSDTIGIDNLQIQIDSVLKDFSFNKGCFIKMKAEAKLNVWSSPDQTCYLSRDTMSHIHHINAFYKFGKYNDTVDVVNYPMPYVKENHLIHAPFKKSVTVNHSVSLGTQIPAKEAGISAGYCYTNSKSYILSDFIDLNGDSYPDAISGTKTQFSKPQGGLSSLICGNIPDRKGYSHSLTISHGINGGKEMDKDIKKPFNNIKNIASFTMSGSLSRMSSKNQGIYSIFDINGDGLPDKIQKGEKITTIFPNYGYGFYSKYVVPMGIEYNNAKSTNYGLSTPPIPSGLFKHIGSKNLWAESLSFGLSGGFSSNVPKSRLLDINGDGLPDIISENGIQYNYGLSFSKKESLDKISLPSSMMFNVGGNASVTGGFTFWFFKLTGTGSASIDNGVSYENGQFIDCNADGLIDILKSKGEVSLGNIKIDVNVCESNRELSVQYNNNYKTNLLRKVKNVASGSFEIDYEQHKNSIADPHTRTVMSKLTLSDLDSVPKSSKYKINKIRYNFKYKYPIYDRIEREFYGFSVVETTCIDRNNKALKTHIDRYYNDNFKTAKLKYKEEDYYLNDLLSETNYEYKLKQISDGTIVPDSISFCYSDTYPIINRVIKKEYEGDKSITTEEQFVHSSYGNVIEIHNKGNVNRDDDDVLTKTYYKDIISNNMVGLISKIEVFDSKNTLLRKSEINWNKNGQMISYLRYNNQNSFSETKYEYDKYGNIKTLILPPNNNMERMTYSYSYEPEHNTQVFSICDSFGYCVKYRYDPVFGNLLRFTDMNFESIYYEYDVLGRLIGVKGPSKAYNNGFDLHYFYGLNFEHYDSQIPIWSITQRYSPFSKEVTKSGGVYTAIVNDGLGRVMQQYDTWGDNLLGTKVSESVEYDDLGRIIRKYDPFILENWAVNCYRIDVRNSCFNFVNKTNFTQYEYDGKDRVTKTILQNGDQRGKRYSISVDNKSTIEENINGNGYSSYVYKNIYDQTESIIDEEGGKTNQKFLPTGEILEITDPEGLTIIYKYDLAGRLLSRVHPDANEDIYDYDNADNMVKRTNTHFMSLGFEGLIYEYHFNRLQQIIDTYIPENSITYYYGDMSVSSLSKKVVGRLWKVEDRNGIKEFEYGLLGEKIKERISIVIPNDSKAISFLFRYNYDSFGRLISMIYPDGEKITYNYHVSGLLHNICDDTNGVLYICDYNVLGQKKYEGYISGCHTEYVYDNNKRIKELISYNKKGEKLLNLNYEFDGNNNIIRITNTQDNLESEMGTSYIKKYEYDKRNWLIKATSNGTLDEMYDYEQATTFMKDGRVKTKFTGTNSEMVKCNGTYNYNYFPHNHQIHTITTAYAPQNTIYSWDLAGNLKTSVSNRNFMNRQVYVWDSNNQLITVKSSEPNKSSYYSYDYLGKRTYKIIMKNNVNISSFVLYPSPFLVMTEKGYTKHYYALDNLLFSKKGNGGIVNLNKQSDLGFVLSNKSDTLSKYFYHIFPQCDSIDTLLSPIRCFQNKIYNTNSIYFYHKDHIGSSSFITNEEGNEIQYLDYLPWGEKMIDQSLNVYKEKEYYETRYKFSGKELDDETGFQYYGARYNDPNLLGWLSVDPKSDDYPMFSPYVFCGNNPIKYNDPNGEWINFVLGGLLGGAVDYASQVTANIINSREFSVDCFIDNINIASIVISTAAGAASSGLSAIGSATIACAVDVGLSAGTSLLSEKYKFTMEEGFSSKELSNRDYYGAALSIVMDQSLGAASKKISKRLFNPSKSSNNSMTKVYQSQGNSSKKSREMALDYSHNFEKKKSGVQMNIQESLNNAGVYSVKTANNINKNEKD